MINKIEEDYTNKIKEFKEIRYKIENDRKKEVKKSEKSTFTNFIEASQKDVDHLQMELSKREDEIVGLNSSQEKLLLKNKNLLQEKTIVEKQLEISLKIQSSTPTRTIHPGSNLNNNINERSQSIEWQEIPGSKIKIENMTNSKSSLLNTSNISNQTPVNIHNTNDNEILMNHRFKIQNYSNNSVEDKSTIKFDRMENSSP